MSTKDKTREKLMGSMRKTKAVAGIGTDNKEAESVAVSPDLPAPEQPNQPRVKATNKAVSKTETVTGDCYQSGRRVWPD